MHHITVRPTMLVKDTHAIVHGQAHVTALLVILDGVVVTITMYLV